MSKSDDQRIAALVRKNAAKAAKAKQPKRQQYDDTLTGELDDDLERRKFFQEMKKREF